MNRAQQIEHAIDLMKEVERTLTTDHTQCGCCGKKTWVSWDERNVKVALSAASTRALKALREMREKGIK